MNYKKIYLFVIVIGVTLLATSSVSRAQFGGEDGRESIAVVLIPGVLEAIEWTFKSSGREILFASIDAEIYRAKTDEHETTITAAEEGGCEDEGGPGLFYIEVIGQDSVVLCSADRPAPPPGWMRDPRMACGLPPTKGQNTYTLRVGLKAPTEEEPQEYYPFALNVSLRGIAPAGGNIWSAISRSRNRFSE